MTTSPVRQLSPADLDHITAILVANPGPASNEAWKMLVLLRQQVLGRAHPGGIEFKTGPHVAQGVTERVA